ncbi:MAG: NAD(P)-binding domain-containing protein [Cyanobacteriota bacterium]
MNIGIIGAGHIGSTLAALLVKVGHSVAISNSRGPESLQPLVTELGSLAQSVTPDQAAAFGEIVVEAIPFGRYGDLPIEAFKGKVVVSAANYYPDRDGRIDLLGLTHTQFLTRHWVDVRVVKAFNTIYWEHLRDQGDPHKPMSERRALPIAGDDAVAKAKVAKLIEELGFSVVDIGSLANSWKQQPGTAIYNKVLTTEEVISLSKS